MVQGAKTHPSTGSGRTDTAFIEALIDACVVELYFADEMTRCGLAFLQPAAAWLTAQAKAGQQGAAQQTELQIKLQQPIQTSLSSMAAASPEVFGVILEF